jgi:hypothetical protein
VVEPLGGFTTALGERRSSSTRGSYGKGTKGRWIAPFSNVRVWVRSIRHSRPSATDLMSSHSGWGNIREYLG